MSAPTSGTDIRRRACWLPNGQDDLEAWLAGHQERTEAKGERDLHPAVLELQELLVSDAMLRMYFERMVAEVPPGKA